MKVWKAKTLFKSSNDKWPKIIERRFNELEREGWSIEDFEFTDKDKHFMLVIYSKEVSEDEYKDTSQEEKRICEIEEYLIKQVEDEEKEYQTTRPRPVLGGRGIVRME